MRPFAVSAAATFRCQVSACALCSAQVWQFRGRCDRYKSEGLVADLVELRDMRPISGCRTFWCHGHSALSRQPEALQIRRRSVSAHRFSELLWNPSTSQKRYKLIDAGCIACGNVHVAVGCPSVRLSVCLSVPSINSSSVLWLVWYRAPCGRCVQAIDRYLLHAAVARAYQQMRVASCWEPRDEAQNILVR